MSGREHERRSLWVGLTRTDGGRTRSPGAGRKGAGWRRSAGVGKSASATSASSESATTASAGRWHPAGAQRDSIGRR